MDSFMFKVSRLWNRAAFWVVDLGRAMIWDYTGKNADLLEDFLNDDVTRDVMTRIPRTHKGW